MQPITINITNLIGCVVVTNSEDAANLAKTIQEALAQVTAPAPVSGKLKEKLRPTHQPIPHTPLEDSTSTCAFRRLLRNIEHLQRLGLDKEQMQPSDEAFEAVQFLHGQAGRILSLYQSELADYRSVRAQYD